MPTEAVSPNPVASPWAAAATEYWPAVRPVWAQAVRRCGSMSRALRSARSSRMPPSVLLWPTVLWPPLRTASSSPPSRARLTTWATPAASTGRTITAGRLSMPP